MSFSVLEQPAISRGLRDHHLNHSLKINYYQQNMLEEQNDVHQKNY